MLVSRGVASESKKTNGELGCVGGIVTIGLR